jgi:hypothetical protein
MKRFSASAAGVNVFATEAELFRAAKVVVLVRLLEPPQVDPSDSSLGPLSKFLVIQSWKGPFPADAAITAATAALCYGPACKLYPTQAGQLVLVFSLGEVQPIYPIISVDGRDVDKKTRELDTLAAQSGI